MLGTLNRPGLSLHCTQKGKPAGINPALFKLREGIIKMENPMDWTFDEIKEYFDSHPDLTLAKLANMTGYTVAELKLILTEG